MNKYIILPLLLALMVVGFGCGNSETEPANHTTADLSDEKLLKDVKVEELQNVIDSYKGDKAVLLNVWATWCLPCVEEFPEIVEIQQKYPEDLQVVFVSADFPDARDRALKFLKDHNVDWTTYFKHPDVKDQPFINGLSEEWTGTLPFTKIISTSGEEVAHWENKASFDKFDKHVQQAIKP